MAIRLLLRRLRRAGWRLLAAEGGNVAIIFGIAVIPIVILAGGVVDYSRASSAKAKFNAAADAAVLAAVNKSATALTASEAEAVALKVFNSNISVIRDASLGSVAIKVTDSSSGRTAVLTYTADVKAAFLGVINLNTLTVGGVSTAASGIPTYIDFYLLLDNSPSMGVGATPTDIDKMVANTSDKCAFACHDLSDSGNYYKLAKKLGVQMRIDVMRQATEKLMDTAAATEDVANQFKMAIYTFGDKAESIGLTTIQSLTNNLSTAKASANMIDLMTVPYQNYAGDTDTNFGTVLTGLNSAITTPGSGLSGTSPQKYVFFVSDGVNDRVLGSTACSEKTTTSSDPRTGTAYQRCQEPLDVAYCTTLKKRGIKVAVLYTTYLPLPTNSWYNDYIKPFTAKISTNMQACASPGLYFEVSPTQGISEAMTALFQKAVQQARLTK
jgi:Flp pilus assembly protein TadG